jgi:hypothetical protein
MVPSEKASVIKINRVYERDHALKVVQAAMADYAASF